MAGRSEAVVILALVLGLMAGGTLCASLRVRGLQDGDEVSTEARVKSFDGNDGLELGAALAQSGSFSDGDAANGLPGGNALGATLAESGGSFSGDDDAGLPVGRVGVYHGLPGGNALGATLAESGGSFSGDDDAGLPVGRVGVYNGGGLPPLGEMADSATMEPASSSGSLGGNGLATSESDLVAEKDSDADDIDWDGEVTPSVDAVVAASHQQCGLHHSQAVEFTRKDLATYITKETVDNYLTANVKSYRCTKSSYAKGGYVFLDVGAKCENILQDERVPVPFATNYRTLLTFLGVSDDSAASNAARYIHSEFREAVIYKVHLMPRPERALEVLAWLVEMVQRGELQNVGTIKIAQMGSKDEVFSSISTNGFPVIVVYVGTGVTAGDADDGMLSPVPGDLRKIAGFGRQVIETIGRAIDRERIAAAESGRRDECAVCVGLDRSPRFNRRINDVLYWAQGNGDDKMSWLPSRASFTPYDAQWKNMARRFTPSLPGAQRSCENVMDLSFEYYYTANCARLGHGLAHALDNDGETDAASNARKLDWSGLCDITNV